MNQEYDKHEALETMATCNTGSLAELQAIAAEVAAKADAERIARMRANPHNGTLGWWQVEGIRHGAIVKASSAMDAVEKARDVVDPSWESPEAFWVAAELPEVIAV
jgi:hypothetical protein